MEEASLSTSVKWKSPSNIALVKYWGKYGRQLPSNPSLSLTLSAAHTMTSVSYEHKSNRSSAPQWSFLFEGKKKPAFETKILKYLESISDVFPLVKELDLSIDSKNTFPHSSGIASSASAMSALAMCLVDIQSAVTGKSLDYKQASILSRLGSGSACRSVYGPMAYWGENETFSDSSNDYALPCAEGMSEVFKKFHDDILIVSKNEKSVSSTAGHALMKDNPFALNRFEQAHRHIGELVSAMIKGDLEKFGHIVEKEALTLHALMMASDPPYILMETNTITAIKEIQTFRNSKGVPVYFTLDAGPNIHLLYPHENATQVKVLTDQLRRLCVDGLILEDKVGNGPEKIQ